MISEFFPNRWAPVPFFAPSRFLFAITEGAPYWQNSWASRTFIQASVVDRVDGLNARWMRFWLIVSPRGSAQSIHIFQQLLTLTVWWKIILASSARCKRLLTSDELIVLLLYGSVIKSDFPLSTKLRNIIEIARLMGFLRHVIECVAYTTAIESIPLLLWHLLVTLWANWGTTTRSYTLHIFSNLK